MVATPSRKTRSRITLRGILGQLAIKMREQGGVEGLASLVGVHYRSLHQYANNERRISVLAAANHLELICQLWGVHPIAYARSRPGGCTIPPGTVIVSAPDGWWLLPANCPWSERQPFHEKALSGLLPVNNTSLPGFELPRYAYTLPDQLAGLVDHPPPSALEFHWLLAGIRAGLTPISLFAPPVLLKAIDDALRATALEPPAQRNGHPRALAILRNGLSLFRLGGSLA